MKAGGEAAVDGQYPTLLARLIAQSGRTQDEEIDGFDQCARAHKLGASLSLRTLRRWLGGHVTTQPRPSMRRAAQLYWGYPMSDLLSPPPAAGVGVPGADMAQTPSTSPQPAVSEPSLLSGGDGPHDQQVLLAPPGQFFAGTTVSVRVFPAVDDGRILALVPTGYAQDPFLHRPRRGLVIAAASTSEQVRLFGMDTRQVRRRLAVTSTGSRLVMPHAYLIDEVTLGILWAVANLDEALLNDDALLAGCRQELSYFDALSRSAGSKDIAADLTAVSAMWLGSEFCARHILRNLDTTSQPPVFWTREQRGEEASTWLLFTHKFDYLRILADRYPSGMARTFCVPAEAVARSPMAERTLLLLAAALMESFGIRIQVTPEPEYAAMDGFALDPAHRAIVANWVGAEGMWHVDVTASRPILREYSDAFAHAGAHSAAAGNTPPTRLRELAEYLGISWTATARRCAQLAEYGLSGLAAPRSRLLSLDGLERACRFLGSLHAITE